MDTATRTLLDPLAVPVLRLVIRVCRNHRFTDQGLCDAITGESVSSLGKDQCISLLDRSLAGGQLTLKRLIPLVAWAQNQTDNPGQKRKGGKKAWGRKPWDAAEPISGMAADSLEIDGIPVPIAPKPAPTATQVAEGRAALDAAFASSPNGVLAPTVAAIVAAIVASAFNEPQAEPVTVPVPKPKAKRKKAGADSEAFPIPASKGLFRWPLQLASGGTLDESSPVAQALQSYALPEGENEPAPKRQHVNHCHDQAFLDLVAAELRVNGHRGGGRKPILLIGPPGLGKSAGIEALMAALGRPLTRVSFGLGTRQDDLIGRWALKNGSTVWLDGVLTSAMRRGEPVLFDEIGSAQDGVLASTYEALEAGGGLTLKEKDGERVLPTDGCWIFASDNNMGTDASGLNNQSRATSPALKSRFHTYQMPAPSVDAEGRVLSAWGIPVASHNPIIKVAQAMRSLLTTGQSIQTWGFRESIDLGLLVQAGLTWQAGWQAVYGAKLPEDLRVVNWEAASRCLPADNGRFVGIAD